jgi:hypothetical protein
VGKLCVVESNGDTHIYIGNGESKQIGRRKGQLQQRREVNSIDNNNKLEAAAKRA